MADRHKLHHRGVEPDRADKVVGRIDAYPKVCPKCLYRVVEAHCEHTGLVQFALIHRSEGRSPRDQKRGSTAVGVPKPEWMVILCKKEWCRLNKSVLEFTKAFVL